MFKKATSTIFDGKLSRQVGVLEKGLLVPEERRSASKIIVAWKLNSQIPLPIELVKKAFILLAKRHPLLRMKIVKQLVPSAKIKQDQTEEYCEYFTEVDDPALINFTSTNKFSAEDCASAVLEHEHRIPFDFSSAGPLWRALLLEETQGIDDNGNVLFKNVIVVTFHHVITDGRSVMSLHQQFLSYLNLLHEGEEPDIHSLPLRPSAKNMLRHRCTPTILDRMLFRGTTRDLPQNPYLTRYPPLHARDPTTPSTTAVVHRELQSRDTQLLMATCKKMKCKFNGAVLAASHIAMARILQAGTMADPVVLRAGCSVDLRAECRPKITPEENVLCVSSFRTEIKVSPEMKDFWKFARDCVGHIKKCFNTGQQFKFLKHCQLKMERQGAQSKGQQDPRVFNVSNMGRYEFNDDGPYRFDGHAASVNLFPTGPVFALLCVTVNERFVCCHSYNTSVTTRQQAEDFVDLTFEILKDACCVK